MKCNKIFATCLYIQFSSQLHHHSSIKIRSKHVQIQTFNVKTVRACRCTTAKYNRHGKTYAYNIDWRTARRNGWCKSQVFTCCEFSFPLQVVRYPRYIRRYTTLHLQRLYHVNSCFPMKIRLQLTNSDILNRMHTLCVFVWVSVGVCVYSVVWEHFCSNREIATILRIWGP